MGWLLTGCFTTRSNVALTPLAVDYPVSASSQYVDASGAIVTDTEYRIVQKFEFERVVEVPRHESTSAELALAPDLNRIRAAHDGEALTNVSIGATEYVATSHQWAANFKILGIGCGLVGAPLTVGGVLSDTDARGTSIAIGGTLLGAGVGLFVLGLTTNHHDQWTFRVRGNVVRRAGASATAP